MMVQSGPISLRRLLIWHALVPCHFVPGENAPTTFHPDMKLHLSAGLIADIDAPLA